MFCSAAAIVEDILPYDLTQMFCFATLFLLGPSLLVWTVNMLFVNMFYVMTFRSTHIYVYEYIRTTHTYISIYISLRIYINLISTYIPLSFSFSFSTIINISMILNLSP